MKINNKDGRIGIANDTLTNSQFNLVLGGTILWGLLLNLIFTVLFQNFFYNMNPLILYVGYFVLAIIGIFISISHSPVMSFIGYNMVVIPSGAVLSVALVSYGSETIVKALAIVCFVTFIMIFASIKFPDFFIGIGKPLFLSLLIGFIIEVICMLLGVYSTIFDWVFVLIFSGYIGFDFAKAQAYDKTIDNAIDSALDIYLDLINLFLRILSIMGKDDD